MGSALESTQVLELVRWVQFSKEKTTELSKTKTDATVARATVF